MIVYDVNEPSQSYQTHSCAQTNSQKAKNVDRTIKWNIQNVIVLRILIGLDWEGFLKYPKFRYSWFRIVDKWIQYAIRERGIYDNINVLYMHAISGNHDSWHERQSWFKLARKVDLAKIKTVCSTETERSNVSQKQIVTTYHEQGLPVSKADSFVLRRLGGFDPVVPWIHSTVRLLIALGKWTDCCNEYVIYTAIFRLVLQPFYWSQQENVWRPESL